MSSKKQCPECGEAFETRQPSAFYCSRKCKTDAANLEAARGKQLYRLAYAWRLSGRAKGQGPQKQSGAKFSDLSWLVDQFIKEDREHGRPPPPGRLDHHTTATAYHTARHRAMFKQREEAGE